jgi:hypothetical protein
MKTLIMGVLLSTVLSGCQSMPTMPVARAAVAAPLGPPLEVGYCIDTTASVGHALIGPGKALLVRHLEALVHPGFPGLHLHLRRIGHDSWSPSAELVTALIPPVHAYPAPPQISYWDAATLRAHKLALYRQGRARVDGELGAARAVLRSTERQIAALDLQIEHNTDVNGCAAKFAIDLWAGMVGPPSSWPRGTLPASRVPTSDALPRRRSSDGYIKAVRDATFQRGRPGTSSWLGTLFEPNDRAPAGSTGCARVEYAHRVGINVDDQAPVRLRVHCQGPGRTHADSAQDRSGTCVEDADAVAHVVTDKGALCGRIHRHAKRAAADGNSADEGAAAGIEHAHTVALQVGTRSSDKDASCPLVHSRSTGKHTQGDGTHNGTRGRIEHAHTTVLVESEDVAGQPHHHQGKPVTLLARADGAPQGARAGVQHADRAVVAVGDECAARPNGTVRSTDPLRVSSRLTLLSPLLTTKARFARTSTATAIGALPTLTTWRTPPPLTWADNAGEGIRGMVPQATTCAPRVMTITWSPSVSTDSRMFALP